MSASREQFLKAARTENEVIQARREAGFSGADFLALLGIVVMPLVFLVGLSFMFLTFGEGFIWQ